MTTTGLDPRPLRDTSGPDQITGDAVQLDVPAAGIATRVLSGGIDLVARIVTVVACLASASYIAGDAFSDAVLAGFLVIVMTVCLVIGPAVIETGTTGRSLGKWVCGLRTVRMDGGAISFRHALVRAFVGYVEIFMTMGVVAFLTAMFTVRSRRLGDLAAGTYVIREPRRLTLPPPLTMPAELSAWADTASVAPLPAHLAQAVPTLAHAAQGVVAPQLRAQIMAALDATLPYVTPPPPPGQDPVAVLTAVAVLRRDADVRILTRQNAMRARLLARLETSGAGQNG